jgi:hypothetical protein
VDHGPRGPVGPHGPGGPMGPPGRPGLAGRLFGKAVRHVPAHAVNWQEEMAALAEEQCSQAALVLGQASGEPPASVSYRVSDYLER